MANQVADTRLPQRFWEKVEQTEDCWLWIAGKDTSGYGRYKINGRKFAAHRIAYEALVGPIPSGLVIDHLCRTRHCVRPDHLEPVTNRANILRGEGASAAAARRTHCSNGHPLIEGNLYMDRGARLCRACHLRAKDRRRAALEVKQPVQQTLTPEQHREVLLRLASGESQRTLAAEYGVSPRTIRRYRDAVTVNYGGLMATNVVSLTGRQPELGCSLEFAPADFVYVGRRWSMGGWSVAESPLYNPYTVKKYGSSEAAIREYAWYLGRRSDLLALVPALRGKTLACWCHPKPCHGDLLAHLADSDDPAGALHEWLHAPAELTTLF